MNSLLRYITNSKNEIMDGDVDDAIGVCFDEKIYD